jgi:hypothetical protein
LLSCLPISQSPSSFRLFASSQESDEAHNTAMELTNKALAAAVRDDQVTKLH